MSTFEQPISDSPKGKHSPPEIWSRCLVNLDRGLNGLRFKAITPSNSFSSLSVASTRLNDPPEQLGEDVDGTKGHLKVEAKCWGRQDIDEMLRRGDDNSLLCKFGLFDDNYAQLQGLEAFSTRHEEYPSGSKAWGIDLSQLVDEKPAVIARKLSDESFNKFRNVPYEEFIRKAAGFSSDCID
jgi:hypothetical protein